MHIRISTRRKGNKTYKYAQLVESFRRPDGVPTHKIIASLGKRTDLEIENLRVALQASRSGKALVMKPPPESEEWRTRVIANLRYLDVVVALETWNRWNLPKLLSRLIPKRLDAVPSASVVAALVIHRCTDPGSKLYAQRWFPRTALPELLGIDIEQFNNTRIHRVLTNLDRIDDTLQAELPRRYQQKDGTFATIFMDVTDAWFEGRGPEMAERNRTKEGFRNRRKIGIVLVCNEHGYPLRWKTAPGKRQDPQCMEDMLSVIQEERWIGEAPLVCDRAMGHAKSVAKLVDSRIRFLTATPRTEIDSYTNAIPYESFLSLSPVNSETTLEEEIEAAGKTAADSGLQKVNDLLYVLDLGVKDRMLSFERLRLDYSGAAWDPNELEGGASFIALARIFQERIDRKEYRSQSDLAKKQGLTRGRVTQIMNTLRIDQELQERILRGEFGYVPERLLRTCIRYTGEAEQRRLLEEHAKTGRPVHPSDTLRPPRSVGRQTVKLRLVAYFNPYMFVEQRARILERRQRIEDFIADLNRRLRSPASHREKESIRIEVYNKLARWNMLKVYTIRIASVAEPLANRKHWEVRFYFNEAEWKRRIRYTGFVLLVGHPDLPYSAEDIVRLYRKKDTIEKDFKTIKEAVKLRPFYHHTDPKVRAHVSLCMLALLIDRTIERRLKRSGLEKTAAACFEELGNGHLNMVSSELFPEPAYIATEPTQEQMALLRSLRLKGLIDPEEIASRIKPRVTP
jgi:transposase